MATALGTVIDAWWLQAGRRPLERKEHNALIIAFNLVVGPAGVLPEWVLECYRRAEATRTAHKAAGEFVMSLSAEDIAAEWPGLKGELERRRVSAGKFIARKARSECGDCFGTGRPHVRVNERGEADPEGEHTRVKTGEMCECSKVEI
jgi:hypothetical protein